MAGLLDKRRSKREDAETPTSSMADIAFLLLIFFLVTTTINVDTGIGMTLPPKLDQERAAACARAQLASCACERLR